MTQETFSEAEMQMLIALSGLEAAGREPTRAALDEYAIYYFGMYRTNWSGTPARLSMRRLITIQTDGYRLTEAGREIAEPLRLEHPRHIYYYDEFYTRAPASPTHARFCQQVYGKDLCQCGMMDMLQLHALTAALSLSANKHVLELGCGNGMVAEYMRKSSGARVTGVDISNVGIRQAQQRTKGELNGLNFVQGDMESVSFPQNSFNAVVIIDSLYFVKDLDALLGRLCSMLTSGGMLGIFYSSWIEADGDKRWLQADGTRLAASLKQMGLKYFTINFTAAEMNHWQAKREAAASLRRAFEAEGNGFLYNYRFTEADQHSRFVQAGNVSRYLYVVNT